ncbi:MAG: gliding motility-associated C-terminal domain-containing protein [Crocinitomicaceae bacterium]|nr:gliding motility-associated C-terminal domain-containing protein [Crocinitomicaceae bacterium]
MTTKKVYFTLLLILICQNFYSQIFFANNALIQINSNAVVHTNGGVFLTNGTDLTNNGTLQVTKNSTFPQAGNFTLTSTTVVNGNGLYRVEQDWTNDATFTAQSSTVNLYGDAQQFITSTNGTITEFNNLSLTGNGSGNNRKKTLQNIDSRVSLTGILALNNRELETQTNDFTVLNASSAAITNSLTFGSEGFVSSLDPGYLIWNSNSQNAYVFPVGSSLGTLRYRPAKIQPSLANAHSYGVRMNNVSADNYNYFLAQNDGSIESANALFFHSIEQLNGNSPAEVGVAYLPSADGDWSGMAHWHTGQTQWNSMGQTADAAISNYTYVNKAAWDFSEPGTPYVLVNLMDALVIPNVFTPNGDGVNDVFSINGKAITDFNLTIVNRWGNTIFESNDINTSWDGTSNGTPCLDGTYFYILKAKSTSNDYNKHGHVTLNAN